MERLIAIEPLGAGWTVRSAAIENDMVFRSGAAAERAARGLAVSLAAPGDLVHIEITLRGGGGVAARYLHPAAKH